MLWFLVGLAVILSVLSLRGERSRAAYYRLPPRTGLTPPATVIVPVKGPDEGLRENLAALASLDYPDYELIVAARSMEDLPAGVVPAKVRVVYAGQGDPETGEKINNLLAGVQAARTESSIYVFADSDGRVSRGWLRALASALSEEGVGTATGYRWHLPERPDAWSMLRSVWNAVIAGGMGPGKNQFCWGGATAICRETFERLDIPAWWRGAVSDDYRLSEAVKAANLRIVFVPGALVAATDHCGATELLNWTRRQMMITRFYAPTLWRLALFAHLVYCGGMTAAVWLMVHGSWLASIALLFPVGVGMWKARTRLRNAAFVMPEY
ncbi:MAG TPA: glycosyltransferase, partial [Bryobacteraceae bacterium]|nr:glycosyltransferase [Bryobacteraceae bacterium]